MAKINNPIFALDEKYATTRRLTQQPVIDCKSEYRIQTQLFLPANGSRKGEGGLRTQGYFKIDAEHQPLISVITVVFNGESCLEKTILNVIEQIYPNVEYIIIDGGSTDGTLDIIRRYENQIDYWISEKDKGIYDAMNKGIMTSTGKWINFMNAGDAFYGQAVLEKIFTSNIDADLIYSDTMYTTDIIFECDIQQNKVIHQSLIYDKNLHFEFGLYLINKHLTISDYIFFQLCKEKKWQKVEHIISRYYPYGSSYSSHHFKQKIAVDILFNNTGLIKSIFWMVFLVIHPFYIEFKKILKK